MTETLTLRRPDDWHVHLRDGDMLAAVAGYTARQFARAIVMPNLSPPITSVAAAESYRNRIRLAVPEGMDFTPLMTVYLTDDSDPDEIARGHDKGVFTAAKLYPANATTNSAAGVSDIAHLGKVLERMERIGMVLCVHGEVTDPAVDIFDREAVFIDQILTPMVRDFPALRIVLEHITSEQAAQFVADAPPNIGATITPHHCLINRNALFAGGMRPHAYCLPVAKRERHRIAVRAAATSGDSSFFLGTDSAPHARGAKESACGCAGIFNAPYAIETYARIFGEDGVLDRLEGFASEHGAHFYGLPLNEEMITLRRSDAVVPDRLDGDLVPFMAGETPGWSLD